MQRSHFARILLCLLILAGVVGFVFGPVLQNDFVNWDDQTEIIQNPNFNPVTPRGLAWNWSHTRLSLYMPVTYIVWGAVVAIAGRNNSGTLMPFAFHALNLGLHLACVWLVFLLILQLWHRAWPALLGALVFAVHPLQAEPVAWASGMYTLLSTALSLGALLAYVAFANSPGAKRASGAQLNLEARSSVRHSPSAFYFLLATALYIVALLTKAASVSLPLAAGLIDLLIIRRPVRLVVRSLTLWIILAIPIVLLAKHFQDVSRIATPSLWGRPLVALDAIGFYLRKLILPIDLIPDYGRNPNWVMQHPTAVVVSAVTALVAILLAWFAQRNAAWITAGIGLLIVGVSPYLGLTAFDFQYVSTVADRYAYFGMVGVALLAAGAVIRSRAAGVALLVAVAGWATLSHRQVRHWRDTDSLFSYTLAVNPRSLIAHNVFGFIDARQGHRKEAEAHYLAALRIWPEDATIQLNLGNLYLSKRPDLALEHYALAVKYQPGFVPYRNSLAAALAITGHVKEAYDQWRQAIALDPNYIDARNNLGDLLAKFGRVNEAADEYNQVLRIDPKNAHAIAQLLQIEVSHGT